MKKILSLLSLLMLCVVGVNAEKVIYSWPSDASQANSITLAEGVTVTITGNSEKKIQNGNKITIGGTEYTSMKVSNGAQNTLTLPKEAVGITFYSYVNKDAATDRVPYWKEVAGVEYTEETSGGTMTSYKNGANPDVRSFSFEKTKEVTFTNTGEQLCYVMEVEYAEEGSEVPVVNNKTIGLVPGVWAADGASFAAYAFNSNTENAWFPFVEASGAYGTQVPNSYANIILVRLKPATAEGFSTDNYGLNWDNKWNQTDDIDFTDVPDKSVFIITGWETYTTLAAVKTQLTEAITQAKTLNAYANDGNLGTAITNAETAVADDDAAAIITAATALEVAAKTAGNSVLKRVVSWAETFGITVSAEVKALVDNDAATAEQLAGALNAFIDDVLPRVKELLGQAKDFAYRYGYNDLGDKITYLIKEFEKNPINLDEINNRIEAIKIPAGLAAKDAINKFKGYAEYLESDDLNSAIAEADAAITSAITTGNVQDIVAKIKAIEEPFKTAVTAFCLKLSAINDATLNAKIAAVTAAATATDPSIIAIGNAVQDLINAYKAYLKNKPLLEIAGDASYLNKVLVIEATDKNASANIFLKPASASSRGVSKVASELKGKMENGIAKIELGDFASSNFAIYADKDITIEKVSLTENKEATEGTLIYPEPVVEKEFSATFKNDADPAWEAVYAYTWSGDGESKVEQLGAWPGTALTANAEGLFEVSGKNATLPEFIIFHNNAGTQTADLAFEEGKEYCYWGEHEFAYQKYVLQNVASGKFWGTGNSWDTQATLVDHPVYQKLVAMPDGKYKMETQVSNGGTSYWFSGDYMDSGEGAAVILTITKTAKGYTIANGDNYYGNNTAETLLGKNLAADSEDALWTITTLDAARAAVANGTLDNPTDATVWIEDYNFNRNNRYSDRWQGWGDQVKVGNADGNMNAESYERTFDVYQELSGLANGVYELNAQAAVTFHDARTKKPYDGVDMPVVYMGDETSEFNEMVAADQLTSQVQLGQKFNAGDYKVEPLFIKVTDGTLKIGARSVRADIWAVWDNFTLTYYGSEATIDQVKNAAIIAEMEELKAKAEDLAKDMENEVVKSALDDAVDLAIVADEESEINAAIDALKAAIDAAEAINIAKDILPKMKELTESTNVYTEEAYNEYYGQWYQKYEAGTITKAEASALQDPFKATGWHNSITCDNFLLSAWDTNPDFQDAAYYINTWSTEGIEGSNNYAGAPFGVPFFEYFTSDGNSLGDKTLTATMNNVAPGWYDVTAKVRVRIKNDDASAYGISMQANDGTLYNVCNGEAFEKFRIIDAKAKGQVGEDGVLKIKFIVAADNNVHWLSFQNVKFVVSTEPVYTVAGGFNTTEGGAADVIFGKTWDPTIVGNNLGANGDGKFSKLFEDVQLEAGTIFYKVVANNSWNDASWGFGTDNAKYIVEEAGKYNITFTFNPSDVLENNYNVDCSVVPVSGTGIRSIVAAEAQNGNVYNLNGQKVQNLKKGLYIVNGKKQVVR